MKHLLISIIYVFLLSANLVSALSYTDGIDMRSSLSPLPASRISEAKLLETYVSRYQENINSLYNSYSQKESPALETANSRLNEMKSALQKIQKYPVREDSAIEVMQSVVRDIKTLNTRMKVYLEQEQIIEQEAIQEQKEKYTLIGKKISSLLDTLIEDISSPLLKKSSLSQDEKSIVRSLLRIREENKKIQAF